MMGKRKEKNYNKYCSVNKKKQDKEKGRINKAMNHKKWKTTAKRRKWRLKEENDKKGSKEIDDENNQPTTKQNGRYSKETNDSKHAINMKRQT